MKAKVLFVSSRPFGQYGTPGIYRFIEEVGVYCHVRVVSPPPSDLTVSFGSNVPLLPIIGRNNRKNIARLLEPIKQFSPDVIYIFQNPRAFEAINLFKEVFPDIPVILDIKSPLLEQFDQHGNDIIDSSSGSIKHVDHVLSLSRETATSWFKCLKNKFTLYPLAIDAKKFLAANKKIGVKKITQLAFVSSLHPKRKVNLLIDGFCSYLNDTGEDITLHVYGDGDDRKALVSKVSQLGLSGKIKFHGLIGQEELRDELGKCDAGIAWVPKDLYNNSPSLKLLEYMAVGLPVLATATDAHLLLENSGFSIHYCEDTPEGLRSGLESLIHKPFDDDLINRNRLQTQCFDYSEVVFKHIMPVIDELSRSGKGDVLHKQVEENTVTLANNNRALRIMIICNSLAGGKGGAEKVATDLAFAMSARGHLCYLGYENRGDPAYKVDESVVPVPFDKPSELKPFMQGAELDCVVVFYFNKRNLLRFVAQVEDTDIPLVVQECTNPDRLRFRNWAAGKLSRARASWEREVATSAASRIRLVMPNYSLSFSSYQRSQVRAFPNSSEPTAIRSSSLSMNDGKYVILVVNGFKPNKNLRDLLAAFGLLSQKYPEWVVRVVGKEPNWDSPHAREVAEVLESYALHDRVQISGPTDDVLGEMGRAHIHAIPSLAEGCPTVVLEAMSVGLLSIGFADCPGTNELIRHNINGILVDPDDRVLNLSEQLSRLMSDQNFRERLGQQALTDSAEFTPESVYDQWESLLSEAADYKGKASALLADQKVIDGERALHARRVRKKLLEDFLA